jgi:histidinol dehydrogenase
MNSLKLKVLTWSALDAAQRRDALRRPVQRDTAELHSQVGELLEDVRRRGDEAVREYTQRFDNVVLESFAVSLEEFATADAALSAEQKNAIDRAISNVQRFHEPQTTAPLRIETSPGVICERLSQPIDSVGLYVPAGTAPLPSTAVMLAVPARIAGCPRRILCTPPRGDGSVDAAVLVAAQRCGITEIFKIGGAQAVAAMAFGTQSIPKVDKVFGPGNPWVTAAKMLVANDPEGAALDMPAGPSEVLVIADETANATFVAADLLAQAEHSGDAQVVFVTTSARLAASVNEQVQQQLSSLPRAATALQAIANSRIFVVADLETAFEVSNRYAPEHLIIQIPEARSWLSKVRNAGSVFLGAWTPESMGDYCSGTNHVLPTYGFARAYSGLSLSDFSKRITVQELSPAGLQDLGPVAMTLARLETLEAHANAVRVRLDELARSPL